MLVYLATFPRSGNSLLQRMLVQNFWRLPTQIKAARKPPTEPVRLAGWSIEPAPAPDGAVAALAPWAVSYRRQEANEPVRFGFSAIPQALFTPEVRRALAASREIHLVKTHHRPFDAYFEGERVIQVLRPPGPAIWSYFRLLASQLLEAGPKRLPETPPTLERVIRGEVQFGCWSRYHRAWREAAQRLGADHLTLRYTDLVADQADGRARLSRFLGLPVACDDPVPFDGYAAKHRRLGVGGHNAYEPFYSRRQLELLWSRHGDMAEELGFEAPDWDLAAPDEQLVRLSEMVELAWKAARPGDGAGRGQGVQR